jgi:hypothetical protein
MAEIGQETWIGGRGLLKAHLDPTRFYDSQMGFTMTDGQLYPAPQWRYSEGLKAGDNKMPGAWKNGITNDVKWQSLATARYANVFTASSTYDAVVIRLWIDKVGSPTGNVKVELQSDSSGEPGSVLQSATIAPSAIGAYHSELVEFTITAESLTSGTDYWIVVYDDAGGSTNSHWEVGYGTGSNDQAKYSTDDGSTWLNTDNQIFFYISVATTARRFYMFQFRGGLYAVDRPANTATASKLYINGSRGKATGGSATTLTDTDQTWTTDEWIGSWVKIVEGTGAGQYRQITDNTATVLTVATWDVNPSTDSLYVIYGCDKWTDISPSSGDEFDSAITSAPLVADAVVFFPRGNGTVMLKMRYSDGASPPAHQFRDEATADADVIYGFTDTTNEYQVYCATNDDKQVSRKTNVAYGSDLGAGTAIKVGDQSANIINMHDYNGFLYVFKADGLYRIDGDKALREDTGLGFFESQNTGEAVANRNFFMYFSWAGFSLQQLQKNSSLIDLASIGPDKGEGLPAGRAGNVSALGFHPAGLFTAIDGGDDNTSCVLVRTDPVGWHEIFRAPCAGQRVRDIHFQDNPGTFPRLWIDLGDDVVFQEWPRNTFNPLKDSGMNYQHETSLTQSDIDMGAPTLPKALKKLTLITEKLATTTTVVMEYQTDADVGGDVWITRGSFNQSPSQDIELNIGDIRKIRIRLRMRTTDASNPPVIIASVLTGFARTPVKYDYSFRVKVSSFKYTSMGEPDHKPQDAIDFLMAKSESADAVLLKSRLLGSDEKTVVVEPIVVRPLFKDNVMGNEGYILEVILREY